MTPPRPPICASGRHCATCRKRGAGAAIRSLIARALGMDPATAGAFECPFGLPWREEKSAAPDSSPPPSPLARALTLPPQPIDPDYDPAKHFYVGGCNCGGESGGE